MNAYQIFVSATRSLNKHKMRSLLTTLGIIVGVVSIIAVMSIGEGAKYKIKKEIEKLGTNFIIVLGGSPKGVMATKGGGGAHMSLKGSDYKAITRECDYIDKASPGLMRMFKVVYESKNWQSMIGGVNEKYFDIRNWKTVQGEYFSEQDIKSAKKVVLIGQTILKELFGSTNPIGKIIRIKKIPFKVIGVLEERGKTPDGRDEDEVIFMPITTLQKKLAGVQSDRFMALLLSAADKNCMGLAANEIKAILRQQHKLNTKDEDDFTVFTQDDISNASDSASAILNILLLVIASISLIVGGIGIMNIMLVTVTERTKEIGIRMAIGASTEAILNQFMLEAVLICLMGGLVGILLGSSIALLAGHILSWPIVISLKSIIISLSSSILIGLFFGYYPARKAAQLNPVDALVSGE
jgi:putative ABC transport system permease protein